MNIIKGNIDTGSSFIYIAASNSSKSAKKAASFICDGLDDQVEINNALKYYDTVFLFKGDYHISDSIILKRGKSLIGEENSGLRRTFGNKSTLTIAQGYENQHSINIFWQSEPTADNYDVMIKIEGINNTIKNISLFGHKKGQVDIDISLLTDYTPFSNINFVYKTIGLLGEIESDILISNINVNNNGGFFLWDNRGLPYTNLAADRTNYSSGYFDITYRSRDVNNYTTKTDNIYFSNGLSGLITAIDNWADDKDYITAEWHPRGATEIHVGYKMNFNKYISNINIEGVHFRGVRESFISFPIYEGDSISIHKCSFLAFGYTANAPQLSGRWNIRSLIFIGNLYDDSRATQVLDISDNTFVIVYTSEGFGSVLELYRVGATDIKNNEFYFAQQNYLGHAAITVTRSNLINIHNNTLRFSTGHAMFFMFALDLSDTVSISNNRTLVGSYGAGISSECNDITLNDNSQFDTAFLSRVVNFDGAKNVAITGNVFEGLRFDDTLLYGVSPKYVSITGNVGRLAHPIVRKDNYTLPRVINIWQQSSAPQSIVISGNAFSSYDGSSSVTRFYNAVNLTGAIRSSISGNSFDVYKQDNQVADIVASNGVVQAANN